MRIGYNFPNVAVDNSDNVNTASSIEVGRRNRL